MATYEILIGGASQPEAHRYNEGDVLAIQIHPSHWGKKELEMGVIVLVDSNKTLKQMQELTGPTWMHSVSKAKITNTAFNALSDEDQKNYEFFKKCCYNIPVATIKAKMADYDETKAQNPKVIYQPFKKESELLEKFTGKNYDVVTNPDGSKKLVPSDEYMNKYAKWESKNNLTTASDCISASADKETEFKIDLTKDDIIKNDITGSVVAYG